jgi:hypothetical protein
MVVGATPAASPESGRSWRVIRQPFGVVRQTWRVVRQPWRGVRQPWRVIRQPWRVIRQLWRVIRQPWRVIRQPWRDIRQPWRDIRQPWRDIRQPWRMRRQPWRMRRQPWRMMQPPRRMRRQLWRLVRQLWRVIRLTWRFILQIGRVVHHPRAGRPPTLAVHPPAVASHPPDLVDHPPSLRGRPPTPASRRIRHSEGVEKRMAEPPRSADCSKSTQCLVTTLTALLPRGERPFPGLTPHPLTLCAASRRPSPRARRGGIPIAQGGSPGTSVHIPSRVPSGAAENRAHAPKVCRRPAHAEGLRAALYRGRRAGAEAPRSLASSSWPRTLIRQTVSDKRPRPIGRI